MSNPNKQLCLRFDIDTHKCMSVGMPNLLALAREKNVKMTFLVNCGRSIDFWHSVKGVFRGSKARAAALSPRRKLGNWHYLRCALLNPALLKTYPDVIRQAVAQGHEIGLHGGRNHELWARFVDSWTEPELHDEIAWGVNQLQELGITARVFASPCAAGGEKVRIALAKFPQFEFISDQLEPRQFRPHPVSAGIPDIPVAISGEGGVAFIEQQVALGRSVTEAAEVFRNHLRQFPQQVVYDHPFFAGDEGLPYTRRLIEVAIEEGFESVHLREIGQSLYQ